MAVGVETPLVGRVAERAELVSLVGLDAGGTAGGAVLLGGDAGCGKTRLAKEIAADAAAAGWRVLVGHCLDFGDGSPPYLPFSEALGRLATERPELTRALIEANPAIARLHPAHRRLAEADVNSEPTQRAALLEAVHDALTSLAADLPLLVVIEDLHWADQSTRDLLHWLFTRGIDAPVTILATYRSDDLHRRHPLRATLAEWVRLPGVVRLQLGPLSSAEARSLVRTLQPGTIAERELRKILARAEGNPFFLEELVAAATIGDGRLPTDLADLLLVRLEQLDDAGRLVVRAASVAGRQVSHALLAAGTALDSPTLDGAVRAAVEANILVSTDGEHYVFRHALLAEAIYQDLLPGERVRLHAAYAEALASGAVDGSAAELSRHAWASHDLVTATRASIRAGDEAMAVGGPEEAIRHYERALELMVDPTVEATLAGGDGGPLVDRIGLVIRASAAATAAGHLSRALALSHDQLLALTVDAPALDRVRLIHSVATTLLVMDHDFDLLSLTTEAVRLVSDEPSSPLSVRIHVVHARALHERARDDEAAKWASEALQLARELNVLDVVSDATILLAKIDERSGDAQRALAAVEAAIVEARAAGEALAELRGLYTLGLLRYGQGQIAAAVEAFDRAAQRANALGHQWAPYGLESVVFAAIATQVAGDWTRASRLVDTSGRNPPELAAALLDGIAMDIAAGRGETSALSELPRLRPRWHLDGLVAITSGAGAIEMYGQLGDVAAAIATHDDVVDFVAALWQQPGFNAQVRLAAQLVGVIAAASVPASAGERQKLVQHADEVAAAAREVAAGMRHPGPEGLAWAARLEAECVRLHWLAGTDPRPGADELVGRWRTAVEAFETFGHRYEAARSRARLAAALNAAGDAAGASAEADRAREVAVRLGAAPLLAELGPVRGLGVPARRAAKARDLDTLTPRERDVLELVATGRSNREIAAALFISAKTVSVHISNLLAKLDAGSRTEAVAIARRRGLLG
ncbi:MAG TPA: AAA family ATPase [Mycobacteriales bacterium]|nr:AAA family ATPase [Mycobacteriales bacterium]HVX70397.1 AAA family ATPase [Mycobacteriales bacterium]